MKNFFADQIPGPEDDFTVKESGDMVEMQVPCCDGMLYTYLIPGKQERLTWVAACWDDTFDFVDQVDADDALSEIGKKWPFLAQQLRNGLNQAFEASGLTRIQDPEDKKMKWAVMTRAEGLECPTSAEDFWANPEFLPAIERVQTASGRLYEEIKADRPEQMKVEDSGLIAECERKEDALFIQFGLLEK